MLCDHERGRSCSASHGKGRSGDRIVHVLQNNDVLIKEEEYAIFAAVWVLP